MHDSETKYSGTPFERPPPLEKPLDSVNLNVLISTPDERPPLLKGHFSRAKGVASKEGFHCLSILSPIPGSSGQNILSTGVYLDVFLDTLKQVVVVSCLQTA